MRELTIDGIQRLANRKGVRKIAVENFLSTMGEDYNIAINNAYLDAKLYRWDSETLQAILEGIEMAKDSYQLEVLS